MECRLARKGDLESQKNIWKQTFGDEDIYIDYYYANRYHEEETALLLSRGEIAAMLSMLPVKFVMPDCKAFDAVMLYAVATHPQRQNQGFATRLMEFSNQYLKSQNISFSILVPAEDSLYDFYRKRGYQSEFAIREARVTKEQIKSFGISACRIDAADPREYNSRRNGFLKGRKFIAYSDEDISYQKELSQLSGADIYTVDIDGERGCFAAERASEEKVIIKEMLLPGKQIGNAFDKLTETLKSKEYILRTPYFLEHRFGGEIHPFAMIHSNNESSRNVFSEEQGYLGLAFD